MNALETVERLKQRFPNEPEYIQAVSQVLGTIEESTTVTQNSTAPTLLSAFAFQIVLYRSV